MDIREVTLKMDSGGASQLVAISGTSAQSTAITAPDTTVNAGGGLDVICTPTVDCFVRQGANPTALATGVDIFLVGGNTYRFSGIVSGNKLAFKTSGATGSVYITPGA